MTTSVYMIRSPGCTCPDWVALATTPLRLGSDPIPNCTIPVATATSKGPLCPHCRHLKARMKPYEPPPKREEMTKRSDIENRETLEYLASVTPDPDFVDEYR